MGHLGARVSALLDGQLSQAESEAAWLHVYGCHACRDLVEREGWIKSRLAGLDAPHHGSCLLSDDLKGSLLSLTPGEQIAAGGPPPGESRPSGGRRTAAAMVGGGAAGAAMLGALVFGPAPASTPTPAPNERRTPASNVVAPSSPTPTPLRGFAATTRSSSASPTGAWRTGSNAPD